MPSSSQTVEVFYSYSHKDETLLQKLTEHLANLQRQGIITQWHDRDIGAGSEWNGVIDEHLNSASVILLLISPSFLASNYCFDIEVKRAMQRHENGEARVIPVILRPCKWQGTPFDKLQALPKGAKPVTKWKNRDEAFLSVAEGIQKAVTALIAARSRSGVPPAPLTQSPGRKSSRSVAGNIETGRTFETLGSSSSREGRSGSDKVIRYLSPAVTALLNKADQYAHINKNDLLILNKDLRASRSDGLPFVLEDKELIGTILKNATAHNMRFKNCSLVLLKVYSSKLRRVDFVHSNLQWLTVYDSELDKVQINDCDLTGALFIKVVVNRETKISNSKLSGTVFYASSFPGRTEKRARQEWPEAKFDGCQFESPGKVK